MSLKLWGNFLLFLLIVESFQGTVFAKSPLVLQMKVSHPRNVDQVSLIFKENTVNLVNNVHQISSNSKHRKPIQLGQFQTGLTRDFKLFRRQIQAYKKLLDKSQTRINKSQILRAIGSVKKVTPHVPSIYIGGDGRVREVKKGHPYFQPLKRILMKSMQKKYKCVSCATYDKKGKSIIRTVKEQGKSIQKRTFSRKNLQCFQVDKKKMECVDETYGIFEI